MEDFNENISFQLWNEFVKAQREHVMNVLKEESWYRSVLIMQMIKSWYFLFDHHRNKSKKKQELFSATKIWSYIV